MDLICEAVTGTLGIKVAWHRVFSGHKKPRDYGLTGIKKPPVEGRLVGAERLNDQFGKKYQFFTLKSIEQKVDGLISYLLLQ